MRCFVGMPAAIGAYLHCGTKMHVTCNEQLLHPTQATTHSCPFRESLPAGVDIASYKGWTAAATADIERHLVPAAALCVCGAAAKSRPSSKD